MPERKPRTKAFTPEQMKQISHNIDILFEQSGLTYNEFCEKVKLSEGTVKSIRTYHKDLSEIVPSKRTIGELAKNLAEYYNYEGITTEALINEDFANIDFSQNRKLLQKYKWYEGIYYGYSISGGRINNENCLQYSIVRIYQKNNQLRCSMLFHKSQEFHIRAERYLKANYSFDSMITQLKKDFHQKNHDVPFYYYDGEMIFSVNSITINLRGSKNVHTRCIMFSDRYDALKNICHHFENATGTMMAIIRVGYSAIAQLVTISFHRKSDTEVKEILTEDLKSFNGGFLYSL